ncbi:hypothetical protein AMELA_G00164610 [Ameiurus melas]|uniref:Uncharacterized protein n=1 Tax=Ameiurus melas TaxID=219545 RepID=A0A7J6AFK8_AMEME|nr:hypothetical protein AMELA_G00164610 [Ameiurus melas]
MSDNRNQAVFSSTSPDRSQITTIILTCVCSISLLINIICSCMFCSRVQGKSVSPNTCCSDTNATCSAEKEINLHYATFTHNGEPADRSTSDLERLGVIYAGIRHLPA